MRRARQLVATNFPPIDVVLCTPEEVEAAEEAASPFLASVLEGGVVIYSRKGARRGRTSDPEIRSPTGTAAAGRGERNVLQTSALRILSFSVITVQPVVELDRRQWQAGEESSSDAPPHPDESSESGRTSPESQRGGKSGARRGPRRRRRRRRIVLLAVVGLLSPVMYSYITTMLQPSSLPLGVRTVEWLRNQHGNWVVDEAERIYYTWNAPRKGEPELKTLPAVGSRARTARAAAWPPRIKLVFTHPLPGEGVWTRTGPLGGGRPPVLVTTFRTETDYPRIVAYFAWFDHRRTALAFYPAATSRRTHRCGPIPVPFGERWRLLATFNAGFTYMDGHNGSLINGRTRAAQGRPGDTDRLPRRSRRHQDMVRRIGCGPGVAFARQSLRLIIQNGRLSPALNDSSQWGATLGNAVRVWRTGVGIDRRGNLIYAAANYQTVITLARILQRAGAVRAMQFDINPEWPTLITYRHPGRPGARPRS